MPWVRIDEEFPDHPKVVGAGPLGIAMQVAALCYCNRHLTDGFVPRSTARRLIDLDGLGVKPDDVIAALLAVGMWVRVDGGYQIHNYDHYQPTREQVLAERERNAKAGKKGGLARAAKHTANHRASGAPSTPPSTAPGGSPSTPSGTPPSNGQATRLAQAQAKSKPVPVPETVTQVPPPSLSLQVDASQGCTTEDQKNRTQREGKAHTPGRLPRIPRHPSDDFVIQRARQIQAADGPEAARAYRRTVEENYGPVEREETLARMRAAMTPAEREQLGGIP
jgi:hypothetical protein